MQESIYCKIQMHAKDIAVAVVVARRWIQAGEWVWVNYAPEDQTLAAWTKRSSCTCCQCPEHAQVWNEEHAKSAAAGHRPPHDLLYTQKRPNVYAKEPYWELQRALLKSPHAHHQQFLRNEHALGADLASSSEP